MVGTDSEEFSLVVAAAISSPDLLLTQTVLPALTSKRMPGVEGVPALMPVDDLSVVAAGRCSATADEVGKLLVLMVSEMVVGTAVADSGPVVASVPVVVLVAHS